MRFVQDKDSDFTGGRRLLEAVSRGDAEAFNGLFTAYYSKTVRFLAGFLDSMEEAEDLAQDVFVKLWQKRSMLPYVENLDAYLYRMARNRLYDHVGESRKAYHSRPADATADIAEKETQEERLFAEELKGLINAVVDRMPARRKTIFTLSRREGFSNAEIAKRLGISKRTVETHISSALEDIRKALPLFFLFF